MTKHALYSVLGISMALAGCGDDGGRGSPDAGPGDAAVDTGAPDTGMPDAGMPDRRPIGDGNDSFADAETLEPGTTAMGVLDPEEDHDFFVFTAVAGDWIAISTTANPDDDDTMVDTVLQLFDADMNMVAENDDAVPRVSTDSEIVYHVPADGTYYVEVLEFSEWNGDAPEGSPDYTYELDLAFLDAMSAGLVEDPETGDDAASATALELRMNAGFVLGTWNDMTDVDVYSLIVSGAEVRTFQANIMPAGTTGYGSTSPARYMWVTDMTGAPILGRIDNSIREANEIGVPVTAGNYLLWVEHGDGPAAANDFYVLKAFLVTENTPELEVAGTPSNDTLATAEMRTLEAGMAAGDPRATFLLAHLSSDTDVDYFSFAVMDGEHVSIACAGESSGSGVRGLRAEIRDSMDAVVVGSAAVEMPPDPIFVEDVTITAPGTYALRLSKASQDAAVAGDFARCAVRAFVPMAMP